MAHGDQEPFFDIVLALINKDLLKVDSLSSPIAWNERSPDAFAITNILQSFSYVQSLVTMDAADPRGSFSAPMLWLTVLMLNVRVQT